MLITDMSGRYFIVGVLPDDGQSEILQGIVELGQSRASASGHLAAPARPEDDH
jgi:hypothetical protein